MTDCWRHDSARRDRAALIDTTAPNAARVGDVLEGGRDNFEADHRAVRALVAAGPVTATIAPAMRAFHLRAMRYLIEEAGIRQFLDTGQRLELRSRARLTKLLIGLQLIRPASCPSPTGAQPWTTPLWSRRPHSRRRRSQAVPHRRHLRVKLGFPGSPGKGVRDGGRLAVRLDAPDQGGAGRHHGAEPGACR
jgi:S-adenosyl methyltransferase